jgi:hypothetical protein
MPADPSALSRLPRRRTLPLPHLASLARQICRWQRHQRQLRVDPAIVAAVAGGSGGGGSLRPLLPSSCDRPGYGGSIGGVRRWIRRRWRRPRADPAAALPPPPLFSLQDVLPLFTLPLPLSLSWKPPCLPFSRTTMLRRDTYTSNDTYI